MMQPGSTVPTSRGWSTRLLSCFLAILAAAPVALSRDDAAADRLERALRFEPLPPLPDPVGLGGPIAGTHGGALIVAGGANFSARPLAEGGIKVWHQQTLVLLDGATSWRIAAPLPRPLAYAACASTDHGVLVAGGSDAETVFADAFLIRFDPDAGEIRYEALPPLPRPTAFAAAEAIGDLVLVLAGKSSKDDTDLVPALWSLDLARAPADRVWRARTPLPGPGRMKAATAAVSVDGQPALFLCGGSRVERGADDRLSFRAAHDAWLYWPEEDRWESLGDLPALEDPRTLPGADRFADQPWPIGAATAMAHGNRHVLVFSGSTDRYVSDAAGAITPPTGRPLFSRRVLAYDLLLGEWFDAGRMPEGVVTTRAVRWNDRIVIPSGETRPGIRTPAVIALVGASATPGRLGGLDHLVIGLYLLGMVALGIWFARRENSTEEFFLGGRKIPWWASGLSIFGTQLSAITFMAIPAIAFATDWRRFIGSIMLLPILVIVIFCYLPFFRRLRVTTAYEYLEARFSVLVRSCASGLFIVFQLARMGVVLLLPAIALAAVTGIDIYLCILTMGIFATLYTALGGISAVIWTDVVQVLVLVGGALLCLGSAVAGAGGPAATLEVATDAGRLFMLDWSLDATELTAWVLIVGFLFTNLVPYTTDQTVIQRYLTTKDEKSAARSLWLNLAITLPTGILFFGLGTALFSWYRAHPAERLLLPEKADQLVPAFVVDQLPAGVAGLVIAGVFAAAMSSLDSGMNSISTAVINDFVRRFGRSRDDRRHLKLARLLTVVLGTIGTLAAMAMAAWNIRYLFDFFQQILGLLGGSLSGVFMLAVFTRRTNAVGAVAGLLAGGAATLYAARQTEVNFLLYAAIGSLTCVLVGYLTSLLLRGPGRDLTGLTLHTRVRAETGANG